MGISTSQKRYQLIPNCGEVDCDISSAYHQCASKCLFFCLYICPCLNFVCFIRFPEHCHSENFFLKRGFIRKAKTIRSHCAYWNHKVDIVVIEVMKFEFTARSTQVIHGKVHQGFNKKMKRQWIEMRIKTAEIAQVKSIASANMHSFTHIPWIVCLYPLVQAARRQSMRVPSPSQRLEFLIVARGADFPTFWGQESSAFFAFVSNIGCLCDSWCL